MTLKLKIADWDVKAYRRRLRLLREIVAGDNQTEFARRLGIDFKRWHNYERGYPVPREVAFLLRAKFPGMCINWIWFGDPKGLSQDYANKITQAEKFDLEREKDEEAVKKALKKLNGSIAKRKAILQPSVKSPARAPSKPARAKSAG